MSYDWVDLLLLSICGGCLGGIIVMSLFYCHFKMAYREYKSAIDSLKATIDLKRMNDEMDAMRIQVKALFGEFYQQEQDYRND